MIKPIIEPKAKLLKAIKTLNGKIGMIDSNMIKKKPAKGPALCNNSTRILIILVILSTIIYSPNTIIL
jgi:hypothetical protein